MDIKTVINIRNFNVWTLVSVLIFVTGILLYLWWGMTYGVWADIGIYSITIVFVLGGLFGILLSLSGKKEAP